MLTRAFLLTISALCVLCASGAPTSSQDSDSESTTTGMSGNHLSPLFGNCSDLPVIQVVEVVREIIVFPNVEDAMAFVLLSGDNDNDNVDDFGGSFLRSDDGDDTPSLKKNKTKSVKPSKVANKTKSAKQPRRISKISLRADDEESDDSMETTTLITPSVGGEKPKKCIGGTACTSAADCGGGKARCIGAFVGTCNCAACVTGLPCSGDAQCGGYQNACNTTRGFCNCVEAHHRNGFLNLGNALLKFCNHKKCTTNDKDACFGLPCHTGLCVC